VDGCQRDSHIHPRGIYIKEIEREQTNVATIRNFAPLKEFQELPNFRCRPVRGDGCGCGEIHANAAFVETLRSMGFT
jgi:hypothetical protein